MNFRWAIGLMSKWHRVGRMKGEVEEVWGFVPGGSEKRPEGVNCQVGWNYARYTEGFERWASGMYGPMPLHWFRIRIKSRIFWVRPVSLNPTFCYNLPTKMRFWTGKAAHSLSGYFGSSRQSYCEPCKWNLQNKLPSTWFLCFGSRGLDKSSKS